MLACIANTRLKRNVSLRPMWRLPGSASILVNARWWITIGLVNVTTTSKDRYVSSCEFVGRILVHNFSTLLYSTVNTSMVQSPKTGLLPQEAT